MNASSIERGRVVDSELNETQAYAARDVGGDSRDMDQLSTGYLNVGMYT
jgi:hypothetical protein